MLLFIFDSKGEVIGQYSIEYKEYVNEVVPLTPVVGERYTITFQVDDGTQALADAQVAIDGYEPALTDGNGAIAFTLPNDTFTYTVSKAGYQSVTGSVEADADQTVQVSLAMLHEVTFTVTDGSDPVEGAEIAVGDSTLVTDSQGEASISLTSGNYQYTVTATGYGNETGTVFVTDADVSEDVSLELSEYTVALTVMDGENPLSGAAVTVDGVNKTTGEEGTVTFALTNGSYDYSVVLAGYVDQSGSFTVSNADRDITVTLVDEDAVEHQVTFTITGAGGATVSGATIYINGSQLTTDENGQAEIRLVNGSYGFTVSAPGYADYPGSVTVNNGATQVAVALTLAEYQIVFTVTAEDGTTAIEGATVEIAGKATQLTDASGTVTFNLTNGSYSYTVTKDGYLTYTRSFTVSNEGIAIAIELVKEGAAAYDVTLTVTDGTNPVSGAVVRIDGQPGSQTTDEAGVAVFSLVNGNYSYTVEADNHIAADGSVTVENAGVSENVTLTPLYEITFEVQVTDGANPIAGATVVIGKEAETTDAEGKASFALPNGDYIYTVSKHGYDTETDQFTVAGAPVALEVKLSETKYTVTFTVMGDSEPLSGASVTIGSITTTTDSQGEAQFELLNGSYQYQVSADGFISEQGTVTVSFGGVAKQVVLARPTVTISVTTVTLFGSTEYTVTVHSTNYDAIRGWKLKDESQKLMGFGEPSIPTNTAEDSMPLLLLDKSGQVIATFEISQPYSHDTVVLTLEN